MSNLIANRFTFIQQNKKIYIKPYTLLFCKNTIDTHTHTLVLVLLEPPIAKKRRLANNLFRPSSFARLCVAILECGCLLLASWGPLQPPPPPSTATRT